MAHYRVVAMLADGNFRAFHFDSEYVAVDEHNAALRAECAVWASVVIEINDDGQPGRVVAQHFMGAAEYGAKRRALYEGVAHLCRR